VYATRAGSHTLFSPYLPPSVPQSLPSPPSPPPPYLPSLPTFLPPSPYLSPSPCFTSPPSPCASCPPSPLPISLSVLLLLFHLPPTAYLTNESVELQELAANSDRLIPSLVEYLQDKPDENDDLVLEKHFTMFDNLREVCVWSVLV